MARVAVLKSRRVPASRAQATDGGSVNALWTIDHLRSLGHEVHVFTRDEAQRETTSHSRTESGVDVWSVPFSRSASASVLERDFFEGRSFVRGVAASGAFAASAFDVFHVHHWTSGVDLGAHVPDRSPVVFTPHLLPSEKARTLGLSVPARVREVERWLVKNSSRVIALSSAEAEALRAISDRRIDLIPNGVSEEFFSRPIEPRPKIGRPRIGCVGRLAGQKGQDLLLDAVDHLLAEGVVCDVELVGQTYGEDVFETQIRQRVAGSEHRVTIHDSVAHRDIADLMSSWDIYIQPSRYESQGIALLEAMGAGLVVVSTPSGAIREYLRDGENGFLASDTSATAIASALRRAIDASDSEDIRSSARATARRRSWTETVTRTACVLEDACEGVLAGDSHSEDTAERLRARAHDVGSKLTIEQPNCEVVLIGSAARGPARPGSDVDLAVICATGGRAVEQQWTASDEMPVDIRFFDRETLRAMDELSAAEFAAENIVSRSADLLSGNVPMFATPGLRRLLDRIEARRSSGEMVSLHQRMQMRDAIATMHSVEINLSDGHVVSAQLALQVAADSALSAAMLGRGWRFGGAKRRIETASSFCRSDPSMCELTEVVRAITCGTGVTILDVRRTAERRERLRHLVLDDLRSRGLTGAPIERLERHDSGTRFGYYGPALKRGLHLGALHHMRCHSGVPKLPETYAAALDYRGTNGLEWFQTSGLASGEVVSEWKAIALTTESADDIRRQAIDLEHAIVAAQVPE